MPDSRKLDRKLYASIFVLALGILGAIGILSFGMSKDSDPRIEAEIKKENGSHTGQNETTDIKGFVESLGFIFEEGAVSYKDNLVDGADPATFDVVAFGTYTPRRVASEAYNLGTNFYVRDEDQSWYVVQDSARMSSFYCPIKQPGIYEFTAGSFPASFVVINGYISTDGEVVYCNGSLLKTPTGKTLSPVMNAGGGFSPWVFKAQDANEIWWHHTGLREFRLLAGAEANSFEFAGEYYLKDKNSAWFVQRLDGIIAPPMPEREPVLVPHADGSTFEVLWEGYLTSIGKDKNGVYFENTLIPGADPETVKVVEHPQRSSYSTPYLKDARGIYYKKELLESADAATFEYLPVKVRFGSGFFAKDNNDVYYLSYFSAVEISGANSETFKILNDWYFKDDDQVWTIGTNDTIVEMEEADANSFMIIENLRAEDDNYIYERGKAILNKQAH